MASKTKISVHVGPPLAEAFAATRDDAPDGNRSGRINALAERYMATATAGIRAARFTSAEWQAMFAVIEQMGRRNATVPEIDALAARVADAAEVVSKWDVDVAALVSRLAAMTTRERIEIMEAAERFLSRKVDDVAVAMAAAGVVPVDGHGTG